MVATSKEVAAVFPSRANGLKQIKMYDTDPFFVPTAWSYFFFGFFNP